MLMYHESIIPGIIRATGIAAIRRTAQAELKENRLLVRVKAVSVNPVDWKIRQGILKLIQGSKFPRIIGSGFAGIVKEVAPGVMAF